MRLFFSTSILLCFVLIISPVQAETFEQWRNSFINRASQASIPKEKILAALSHTSLDDRVITLDRKQPEGTMTLAQYVLKTVTPQRVSKGQQKYQEHQKLLQQVEKKYGVPAYVLLALWGKETDYGGYTGTFETINSLATLAYEGRRRAFFEQELLNAIQVLDYLGWTPEKMKGSWAGAVGQCQFMPSNYLKYAVDGDGNGRADLWHSMPDVFASMAHFLVELGWNPALPWGQRVTLPAGFDNNLIGRDKEPRPLSFWMQRGVRFTQDIPAAAQPRLRLYQPDGPQGPAYALTANFDVFMRWNRSGYFATAVGRLSDRIKGLE